MLIYYAANVFWIEGTVMVPSDGFRRYPVDFTHRISVSAAKHRIAGTQPDVALKIKTVVDPKKKSQHFVLTIRETSWWHSLKTEEMPWDETANPYGEIAKTLFKSRWAVETVMAWNKRNFETFAKSTIEKIKEHHPDGAFDVSVEEESLVAEWLFLDKNGSLTDTMFLKKVC